MKITKTPKRLAEPMLEVRQLLKRVTEASDDELPSILGGISEWCWPRGDLHFWVHILNRFDSILEETCRDYDLHKLQINEFTPLRKRILVSILKFTRLLIENCTSRRLYASYEHLNNLLFTRDVDVLETTLRLMLRFSQQHSSQHPKAELLPSQEKLSTLAVTWAPRDHGLDMADVAKEGATIPADLLQVKFQFYRRREADNAFAFANLAQTGDEGGGDTEAAGSASTPVRTRPRERVASTAVGVGGNSVGGSAGPVAAAGSSSATQAPSEGMTTIELGRPGELGSNAMDVLADAIETHSIPPEDHFELYQRIRLAMAMPDLALRRQLLLCRLLAIACYAHIVPESTASTQLFLYEPEIVPRLAALVDPANLLPGTVVSGSLYALDALGRYRSKLNEVLSSVNASVNHGILLQILRNISDDLATGTPTQCDDYVDAYFGLVSFVTSTNVGSGLVVGAGLLQLLIKLVDQAKPESYMIQRSTSRAVGLLDSIIYAYVPAFTLFCQAHGLDIFVRRIEEEVEYEIHATEAKMDTGEETGPDHLFGKVTFGRAHLLRGFLQSISHMMVSTGTADGLRNLIDSSLLGSIKKIMEQRRIIGPQNLALAISIMATFVHNEPTSLGIIQEKKLPETFLNLVNEDIEAQFDVINAIPNAIGALCLNQAGLDMFSSQPMINKLLSLLTSERHIKVLQDQDNVTVFGASIDELIRHQPTMKQVVLDDIFKVLESIQQAGKAYEPPITDKVSMYRLCKVEASDEAQRTGDGDQLSDSLNVTHQGMALADVIMDEADLYNRKDDATRDPNSVASFMDVTARFLEVLFQSSSHCKDFLRANGLEKLLNFYNLPCLSYNFASTVTADSMVHLLRYISEVNPNTVITALLREINSSLEETKALWNQTEETSVLSKLLKPATEQEVTDCNEKFRQLIKLNARMQLLSDVAPTFTYSGSKTPTTLLQVLNATPSIMAGNRDVATINDLGDFQRAWTWETILFKADTHSLSASVKMQEASKKEETGQQGVAEQPPASSSTDSAHSASLVGVKDGESGERQGGKATDPNDPLLKNTIALRYIASQVKASLGSFFAETNRLLSTRRAHDSSHKRFAALTATNLGNILKENMVWKNHPKVWLSCDYMIVMITQASKLLYEERPSQACHAQTIVLVPFMKQGGVKELVENYRRCNDELERRADSEGRIGPENKGTNDAFHACGALQMALDLMLKMVSHAPLLDSPSTQTMKSKEGVAKESAEYFEPRSFLISLRLTIVQVIRETWMKRWLTNVNYSIVQSVLRVILKVVEAQGEVTTAVQAKPNGGSSLMGNGSGEGGGMGGGASAALVGLAHALGAPIGELGGGGGGSGGVRQRSTPMADEGRMRQLTEMGFGRRAARHALLRCSNNLNAATEYLLMHPEVASTMQGDENEDEGAGTAAEETQQVERPAQAATTEPSTTADASQGPGGETGAGGPEAAAESAPDSGLRHADTPMAESMRDAGEGAGEEARGDTESAAPVEASTDELVRLDEQRSEMMETLLVRALELNDQFAGLVFDVRDAVRIATKSYSDTGPLDGLFASIQHAGPQSVGEKMDLVSVRLHLLALIFNDHSHSLRFSPATATQYLQSLVTLMHSTEGDKEQAPTWLASYFLVLSALLRAEDAIPTTKMIDKEDKGEHETPPIWTESLFAKELPKLLEYSLQQLSLSHRLQRGDLLALYRFLVILTRRPSQASVFLEKDGLSLLLRPFSSMELKDVAGCRPYAVLVMRHVIESGAEVLHATMTQEVRAFFSQSRVKAIDTSSATKSLGPAILREPDVFLDVMKGNIELVDYKASQNQGILKLPDAGKASSAASSTEGVSGETSSGFRVPLGRGTDEAMDLVPPSPTKQGANNDEQMLEVGSGKAKEASVTSGSVTSASLDAVIHHLLSELLRTSRERSVAKESGLERGKGGGEGGAKAGLDSNYFYTCFLLQSLTELLSSYTACKTSFLNFTRKRLAGTATLAMATASAGKRETGKARPSGSALAFFLSELVPLGFVQSREHEEMRRLMSISNWAMSTLVALCADVVAITADVKEVSAEVVFARKSLLDGIAKAIKEATGQAGAGRANEGIESRYGRLYSLSDLSYRLLKARPNVPSAAGTSARSMDDLTLHMAKTMLERNFVTVLTSALAEVDLNLPMVKSLLDRILKPLEYLTKVAIKMNKAERKNDKRKAEAEEFELDDLESLEDDEMDEEEEGMGDEEGEEAREETPDFYRNSSLGMHTGDLENQVSYDDDEDEDEDEDEEMDEEMEGVVYSDDDTEDSDDEDDDDIDEEHIVEVMEEDDEDSEEEEDTDGSEEEEDDGIDEDEDGAVGSWIDEDDEEAQEAGELDFIIDGDEDEAQRLFHQANRMFRDDGEEVEDEEGNMADAINYEIHEGEGDEDEEGEEMDDDDESALEEIFEHGDLPTNMQAPLVFNDHAPMDRFGANWNWTGFAPPQPRRGAEAEPTSNAGQVISPFAFLRQRPSSQRQSRSRHMNFNDALDVMTNRGHYTTDGSLARYHDGRRGGGEDVASHPLLTQAPSQSDLRGAASSRLNRNHALRRAARGEGDGYQDWAQSLEGLMESGAMQFLETLLHRNGAGQGGPGAGEAIHISLSSGGGMPRMSIGSMPPMTRLRDARGGAADRSLGPDGSTSAESTPADAVAVVQEFSPTPTLSRWSEGMRIMVGAQVDERLRLMRAHIVNTLRPSYVAKQEENRKKREQMEEKRKNKEREREEEKESAGEEGKGGKDAETAHLSADRPGEETEGGAEPGRAGGAHQQGPDQTSQAPRSADVDVEMAEGATSGAEERTSAPVATPASIAANLELNSLQQGLEELDSRQTSETNDSAAPAASATSTAPEGDAGEVPGPPASTTAPTTASTTAATEAPRPRVTTTINGNEVDITDSGIDPTFLEALPEEMREEVLNQHFRERRAAEAAARALAAGGSSSRQESSNIAPEFLEALPPEIRAEVIQQEAVENQRRRREERRGEEGGGGGGASDMDPASFLASLNPDLRGAVLMEQDEGFLNSMPSRMRQEMEDMMGSNQRMTEAQREGHRRQGRSGAVSGLPLLNNASTSTRANQGEGREEQGKKAESRDAIQLLDKAGIAALVRLLFFPQMDSNQSGLRDVLINLSENSKSRAELLNLLLMILAEGTSTDSNAVDKSYSNMSVRVNKAALQTPTRPTPKRSNTTPGLPPSSSAVGPAAAAAAVTPGGQGASVIAPLSRAGDEAPFLIASRSIETLLQLTSANEQAAHYFLKDDASNVGLMKWFKKSTNLKGKDREKVSGNAPINILLVLLGKPSILANAQLVDSLIALLNTVTRPLPSIMATRRRAEEERAKGKEKKEGGQEAKEKSGEGKGEEGGEGGAKAGEGEKAEEEEMPVGAPQISEERMASVVKPLSISISSKGFQNTLAVASNLSVMDGARDVITSALQREANMASKSLMSELDDLLESLPPPPAGNRNEEEEGEGEEGEESEAGPNGEAKEQQRFSSPALTKLASPSSSQTVILRSLRALEWVMTRPKTANASTAPTTLAPVAHQHAHHGHAFASMF